MKRKIVVAMDSFKGCLDSEAAGNAVRAGLLQAVREADVTVLPMADGGEGTASVLSRYLDDRLIDVTCHDALMREAAGKIFVTDNGETAIVELAEAAGITRLADRERSVMNATTYGLGELISAAIDMGVRDVFCTLGGSATNDAGLGAMQALGLKVLTVEGEMKRQVTGRDLRRVTGFDRSGMLEKVDGVRFSFLYDADIPFVGPSGAVRMYSRQKGASDADMEELEGGMVRIADIFRKETGVDVHSVRGAGAAGGCGGGMAALLGASGERGIDRVLDASGFDRRLEGADLVITGEGRTDAQTRQGKVAQGILERASKAGVPVVLIAGAIADRESLTADGYRALIDINEGAPQNGEDPCDPAVAKQRLNRSAKAFLSNFQ